MPSFYPDIPEKAAFDLEVVIRNVQQDPDYLSGSHYSGHLREFLASFSPSSEEVVEVEPPKGKWEKLEYESDNLFRQLIEFSDKLDSKDNTETMAFFRTATSLLDKIVGIQERAANLRQISKFHDTVLTIMDDLLEPGQRTEAMARLRHAITPED